MGLELIYLQSKDFQPFYEDLTKQFPQKELKTYKEFLELLELENYKLIAFKDKGKLVAYSLWYSDKELNFLWLDYLAVLKEFHSQGYGSKILKAFFKKHESFKYCFFEVEKPETEQAVRRHKFYERLGCKNTGIKYFFPNKYEKLEMDLLYYPINSKILNGNGEVVEIISKVHKDLHRVD